MSARAWKMRRNPLRRWQQWGRKVGLHRVWFGPCVHGRDPWTRCNDCGELTEAEAKALAGVQPTGRERLAERARKRREWVATMLVWPYDMTSAPAAVRRRLRKDFARRALP